MLDPSLVRATVAPREIRLELSVDPALAEFSGMDWWEDRLVLLSQYPERFASGDAGALVTIDRERLRAYIDGRDTSAIRPELVPFDDHGLPDRVPGWDGYEAIAFSADHAYLAVERRTRGAWEAVIARATIGPDGVIVEPDLLVEVPGASRRPNFTEEALVFTENTLWSLHELNGRRANPLPRITRFATDLTALEPLSFPPLEYRVTDATAVDAMGRFWVFNQFWPGEAASVDATTDALAPIDRPGGRPVERIVAMRRTRDGVEVDRERGVLQLATRADDVARNWEGLVRWEDTGFLIVTDRHPRTIFAYVERP